MFHAVGFAFAAFLLGPPGGLIPVGESLTDRGYEEVGRDLGVTVYRHAESTVPMLAAEGRFSAPPEQVLDALLAYERHPGTLERVAESRVISRGKDWLLVYQRLALTVIDDRDYTMRVEWGKEGDLVWLSFRTDNRKGPPEKDGVVRLEHHRGGWQLCPIRDGRATLARYQVSIDMAGWVPQWMARLGSWDEIPGMFGTFRRMVRSMSR